MQSAQYLKNEKADFSPLIHWLKEKHYRTDAVFAEKVGFQLFKYIYHYYCEIKIHLVSQ